MYSTAAVYGRCNVTHASGHTVASQASAASRESEEEGDVESATEELSIAASGDDFESESEESVIEDGVVARAVITLAAGNDEETTTTTTDDSLIATDENYVCDISLMSIGGDGDDGATTTESDAGATCDDCADLKLLKGGSGKATTIGGHCHRHVPASGGREVRIARRDEEQTITDLVRAAGEEGALMETGQNQKMRVAFGIILRLVLPLAHGVVRGIRGIRDARFLHVLRSLASSRQALTNLIAFAANSISMNLSAVQVSHRIEPILKILKIRKSHDGVESLPDSTPSSPTGVGDMPEGLLASPTPPSSPTSQQPTLATLYSPIIREPKGARHEAVAEEAPPKCCTLQVLAEPPPGTPIRADIVFIHGLHGSLANTWKQGLWTNERQPVGFERPPKPPVRPPKRPRHSRGHLIHPQHRQKRARFAQHGHQQRRSCERGSTDEQHEIHGDGSVELPPAGDGRDFSFVCGEPRHIEICDGVEYTFPTFRLRMNDNGRQLRAELESILNADAKARAAAEEDNADGQNKQHTKATKGRTKTAAHSTPTNEPFAMPTAEAWTSTGATNPSPNDGNYSKCWPGDWLPLDCPGVRVLACNYTTDQYLWRPLWKKKEPRTNLVKRAREMAELLVQARVGYGHPIVWVGHSKGGLFVKQLIVDAWETGRLATEPFWRSARGCFFYSVPHRGSHLASIKAPLLTRSIELVDIEKNSKYLLDLHQRFASLYHLGHLKIEVFSFVETALTLMSVLYLRIVGADSADPGIGDVCGIRLDHREICKPRSRECILYKELVKMINKVC